MFPAPALSAGEFVAGEGSDGGAAASPERAGGFPGKCPGSVLGDVLRGF